MRNSIEYMAFLLEIIAVDLGDYHPLFNINIIGFF